jgi:hypothetical protein
MNKIICTLLAFLMGSVSPASARLSPATPSHAYTDTQIVDAIYIIEGGAKTRHPYGILKKYKVTTPRQACFNTVAHARRDWEKSPKSKPFTTFLRDRYCPLNAKNDPKGLNKNWLKNLHDVMERRARLNKRRA